MFDEDEKFLNLMTSDQLQRGEKKFRVSFLSKFWLEVSFSRKSAIFKFHYFRMKDKKEAGDNFWGTLE